MKIKVDIDIVNKCYKFAEDRLSGSANLYRARGEMNISKIKEDIAIGSISEFAVYTFLKLKYPDIKEPDLNIYDSKSKRFLADLSDGINMFHVKSQTLKSSKRYGLSWLFQKEDKLFKDERKESDNLVLCEVDGDIVDIKCILKVKDIKDSNILSEPKVTRYSSTKVAIYYSDLEKLGMGILDIS